MSEASMQDQTDKTQFAIQRIYLKDLSFESPQSPKVFMEDWNPEMKMDISTSNKLIEAGVHEVVLHLTVTVGSTDKVAFIAEVKQAGVFMLEGFEDAQLKQLLGAYCAGILYPYAREVVTSVVTKGSFPQLVLAPINFDALYAEQQSQQDKEPSAEASFVSSADDERLQ